MKREDKILAETILQELGLHSRLIAIPLCAEYIQQLVFTQTMSAEHVYLRTEAPWMLFDRPPAIWPQSRDDFPIWQEDYHQHLQRLVGWSIARIILDEPDPHLAITFENGTTLWLHGRHERYESWDFRSADFTERVIAAPGGEIVIWTSRH